MLTCSTSGKKAPLASCGDPGLARRPNEPPFYGAARRGASGLTRAAPQRAAAAEPPARLAPRARPLTAHAVLLRCDGRRVGALADGVALGAGRAHAAVRRDPVVVARGAGAAARALVRVCIRPRKAGGAHWRRVQVGCVADVEGGARMAGVRRPPLGNGRDVGRIQAHARKRLLLCRPEAAGSPPKPQSQPLACPVPPQHRGACTCRGPCSAKRARARACAPRTYGDGRQV